MAPHTYPALAMALCQCAPPAATVNTAGFLPGSSSRAGSCCTPSSRTPRNATGASPAGAPRSPTAATGTATAASVWAPPSLFASSLLHPDAPQHAAPPYKQPPRVSPPLAPPVPPGYPLPYALHLYSAHPYPLPFMAVLPDQNARYHQQPPHPTHGQPFNPLAPPQSLPQPRPLPVVPAIPEAPTAEEPRRSSSPSSSEHEHDDDGTSNANAPPKRHACIMCHKSFDRPSTLRKHLLVHTGEKAHECANCHRRFSVASNLRRHARRCVPAASGSSEGLAGSSEERAGKPEVAASASSASSSTAPAPRGRKRRASSPPPPSSSSSSSSASSPPTTSPPSSASSASSASPPAGAPRPKRRRRAPSPHAWVPESLRAFDLTPFAKATPVPLPPVAPAPAAAEERDSFVPYDAAAGRCLYHPRGWTGRLPGPAPLEPESLGAMGVRMLVI